MTILVQILAECWWILVEAAPYILFGFFAAGVLKAFLPEAVIARHLGKNSFGSVLKASLFGIPLPLCSCGVIPAAVRLRKQGASKGASAAFLVSVPETGLDSIAITWALLDPLMTVIRPVAAFLTATLTGVLINLLPETATAGMEKAGQESAGCCGTPIQQNEPDMQRFLGGIRYAFGEMLKDIGGWLMLGIAVAGIIAWLLPDGFFVRYAGNEGLSLLIMLTAGIPLYICASASTPVAAALVLKGLSPGAALVFLLAGPATNAATIAIVSRFWGRKATAVYLAAIAVSSLFLGWLTNRIYAWSGLDISRWIADPGEETATGWEITAAVFLLLLLFRAFLPRRRGAGSCTDEEPSGT